MKLIQKLWLLPAICSLPCMAFAQSDEDSTEEDDVVVQIAIPKKRHAAKLVLGGQFCGEQSFENAEELYRNGNLLNKGGKLFFRIYFAKPLAIEVSVLGTISSLNTAHSEGNYFIPGAPSSTTPTYLTRNNRAYSYTLMPLSIQYHFFNDKKLQPYFGIGGGMVARSYDIKYYYLNKITGKITPYGDGSIKDVSGIIQLEQGITYRGGKHWQVNQSVYYQHEYDGRRNNIGLNIGIGYFL